MTESTQDDLEARLDAAFEATPRVDYLPEKVRDRADQDRPLPIPRNQTNSQPSTVRDMLWLLEVPEGAKVLDVGAGSGWTTALLAHLTGPEGSVLGVELEPNWSLSAPPTWPRLSDPGRRSDKRPRAGWDRWPTAPSTGSWYRPKPGSFRKSW